MNVSLGDAAWWLSFVCWMALIAYYDLRLRRVPNVLIVWPVFTQVLFLAYGSWSGQPLGSTPGWGAAFGGFAVGLAFIVLWSRKIMGAGDVKFMAAVGLWVGWAPLLGLIALASILAGLHAIMHFSPPGRYVLIRLNQDANIPFAGYMALAGLSMVLMRWNSDWCSLFSLRSCTPY